jgi:hypothetical protein
VIEPKVAASNARATSQQQGQSAAASAAASSAASAAASNGASAGAHLRAQSLSVYYYFANSILYPCLPGLFTGAFYRVMFSTFPVSPIESLFLAELQKCRLADGSCANRLV